jgi:hypothetical protein
MNPQGHIPRSRGGICGALLILLGLWGGLAPFVGPYFHFGYTPDRTWAYSSGRLYFSIIPGAAALLGGLLVVATRNRGVGVFGGVLGALGGAWFVAGSGFVTYVLKRSIAVGGPIAPASATSQALRTYLELIGLFTGVGLVILFVGALAIGRFSMVSASDVAADAGGYYADFPAAQPASQPDLSRYPSAAGQYSTPASTYPTSAGQFPAGSEYTPASQFPDPPSVFPDTTTAQYPPDSPG